MSDVNEFNVATQEQIVRPYTEQEKQENLSMPSTKPMVIVDSSLSFEDQKISHRQQLIDLGVPIEKINKILGDI